MVIRAVMNTLWGLMILLRLLAIAAVPLALLAAVYLSFVYGVWSHILSEHHQHRRETTTWLLSFFSVLILCGFIFGLHELGRWHRSQRGIQA